jgi:SseB protein N-terminal domain
MSDGASQETQFSNGFRSNAERVYLRLFSDPDRVSLSCGVAAIAGLVVGALLLAHFGSDFWSPFNEVAAVVATLGVLLALPALSYAVRAETRLALIDMTVQGLATKEERPVGIEQKVVDVEAQQGLDSAFLLPAADKSAEQQALEAVITSEALGSGKLAAVVELLAKSNIYALGEPAGDTSASGQGTESDLLHFTVEADGEDQTMLPVFTQSDFLKDALERNPDWGTLSVLELVGSDLLHARDPDVTLVVNPWSSLEFQIPPGVGVG